MTPAELTQSIIDLISDKTKWTHRRYAKTADGRAVAAHDPDAIAWGSAGALDLLGGTDPDTATIVRGQFFKTAQRLHPSFDVEWLTVESFNDHFRYDQTMEVWRAVLADLSGVGNIQP